jgi:hypothetical protein
MRIILDCPACGASNPTTVAQLDELRRQAFLDFDQIKYCGLLASWLDTIPVEVLRCRACGHAWYRHQPEPDQLSLMYASGRPLATGAIPTKSPSPAMQQEMRRVRRLTNAAGKEPLLLDYGSGRGRWALAAVAEGFRVVAYEPSVERGGEADPPFHLVHSESELAGLKFDVIQLEQVLEHVPDPFQTLTRLKIYCQPHTLIRITVPNILRDSFGPSIWETWPFDGESPHVLAPFEHLHGFTPISLNKLIRRAGYKTFPLQMLWRQYPILAIRNVLRRIYPPAGQTMLLTRPGHL